MAFRKKKKRDTVKVRAEKKASTSLTAIYKSLVGRFGKEIVWTFGSQNDLPPVEVISTKSISLNWALRRGGFPRGRIIEIFGKESSGKSTVCYHLIKCAQELGLTCVIVDTENSMDTRYLSQCGIDISKNFALVQPDTGEQAYDIIEHLLGKVDVIVLDSLAFLSPTAEAEGDVSDQHVGLQARLNTRALRRIVPMLKGSKTVLVLTNQIRAKIGGFGYGPQETTPGGNGVRHAASIRLSLYPGKPLKAGDKRVGFMANLRVVKNKVAPPFRNVEVPITYGYGVDDRLDFILAGVKAKIIKKTGGVYYIGKRSIGNGWLSAWQKIQKSERLTKAVTEKINQYLTKAEELGEARNAEDKPGD